MGRGRRLLGMPLIPARAGVVEEYLAAARKTKDAEAAAGLSSTSAGCTSRWRES